METRTLDRRGFLTRSAAAGVGVVAAAGAGISARADTGTTGAEPDRAFLGTWLVTVTFTSGTPGLLPPPFLALFTYVGGGGVLETDQTVAGSPTESPVHGSWERLGGRRYRYRCLGFNFNADGSPFGFSRFGETINLMPDGLRYAGAGWSVLVDTGEHTVFSGEFTTAARRLPAG